MEAIVFIIFEMFFRSMRSFSKGIFGHMTSLDQSRASENIIYIWGLSLFTQSALFMWVVRYTHTGSF